MQLRYIVEYGFFVEGVRGALESMVIMARRIREEMERRRLFTGRKPATPVA
jgi:hypothetical protein